MYKKIKDLLFIYFDYEEKRLKYLLFLIGFSSIFASKPIGLLSILFVIFPLFFIKINQSSSYKDFIIKCFFFYSGYFTAQMYWLPIPLTKESGLYFLMPIAILLPTILLVPIFLVFSIIYRFTVRGLKIKNDFINILIFSICFSCAEFFRSNYLFNGFPWQIFGHFFIRPVFIQMAEFFNIYILSCFAMMTVLSLCLIRNFKSNFNLFFFISIILINMANFIYGFAKIYNAENKIDNVFIWGFQSNFPPEKYSNPYVLLREVFKNFSNRLSLGNNNIIIGSEAIIPFSMENKDNLSKALGKFVPNQQSILITGGVYYNKINSKIYNSIYFINSDGSIVGLYKKKHLVPFGEYIPMRKFIPKFVIEPIAGESDFGDVDDSNNQAIMYQDLPIMIPAICYDIIFSEDVKNTVEKYKYKDRKQIIVNLTNDIWTGLSIAPYQHLAMAQFTAVRSRTPIVRVSNNGISAIIDQYGRIVKSTELNKESILTYFFKEFR